MLKKFYDMEKEIKNYNKQKFKLYIKQSRLIVWSLEKIRKVRILSCMD